MERKKEERERERERGGEKTKTLDTEILGKQRRITKLTEQCKIQSFELNII